MVTAVRRSARMTIPSVAGGVPLSDSPEFRRVMTTARNSRGRRGEALGWSCHGVGDHEGLA